MRQFLLLITVFSAITAFGQDFSQGRIAYKETMNLNLNFEDDDDPQMAQVRAMLPTSRTYEKELLFKDGKSLYRDVPSDEPNNHGDIAASSEDGNMEMQIEIARPENIVFQDWVNKKVIQKREFMGRDFLVLGTTEKKWKITAEVKEIAGYQCQKAILDDTIVTEAWFSSEIPLFTGPESYNNLPGLILAMTVEDGRRTIEATEVILQAIEEEVVAPSKGKKVNPEEFYEIVDAKMKEMQSEYGGSGRVIMIREDN